MAIREGIEDRGPGFEKLRQPARAHRAEAFRVQIPCFRKEICIIVRMAGWTVTELDTFCQADKTVQLVWDTSVQLARRIQDDVVSRVCKVHVCTYYGVGTVTYEYCVRVAVARLLDKDDLRSLVRSS